MDANEGTLGVIIASVLAIAGTIGAFLAARGRRKARGGSAEPREKPQAAPEPAPEPRPDPESTPAPVEFPAPREPVAEPEPEPTPPKPAVEPAAEPAPVITMPPEPPRQPFITTGPTDAHVYVDPVHGNDRHTGLSLDRAVQTLHAAHDRAAAGNVIAVRRGALWPDRRLLITKPVTIAGYGWERPMIDLSRLGTGSAARMFTPKVPGVHLKGFEFKHGSGMDGGCIYVDVDGIDIKDMHAHDIDTSIVYVYGGSAHISDVITWRIGDGQTQGTNVPDGIVVTGRGSNVEIVRPVVMNGPDDGIDLFQATGVTVKDFVIIGAGYYWTGTPGGTSVGDGNGVKLGGARSGVGRNRAVGGLVVGSRSTGVSHNQAPDGRIEVERVTTVASGYHGIDVGSAYGNAIRRSASIRDVREPYYAGAATSSGNSWDLGITPRLRDRGAHDYALANIAGIGASEDALEAARYWMRQPIDYYAGPAR